MIGLMKIWRWTRVRMNGPLSAAVLAAGLAAGVVCAEAYRDFWNEASPWLALAELAGAAMAVGLCVSLCVLGVYVAAARRHRRTVSRLATNTAECAQLRASLRSSQDRLQALLANLPALIWTTDAGVALTSAMGRPLMSASDRPGGCVAKALEGALSAQAPDVALIAEHRKALEGGRGAYELSVSGTPWDCRIEPLRDAGGRIVGCVGLAIDATGPKRAQEAIVESERLLQTIVDSLPVELAVLDEEARIIAVNCAWRRGRAERGSGSGHVPKSCGGAWRSVAYAEQGGRGDDGHRVPAGGPVAADGRRRGAGRRGVGRV